MKANFEHQRWKCLQWISWAFLYYVFGVEMDICENSAKGVTEGWARRPVDGVCDQFIRHFVKIIEYMTKHERYCAVVLPTWTCFTRTYSYFRRSILGSFQFADISKASQFGDFHESSKISEKNWFICERKMIWTTGWQRKS